MTPRWRDSFPRGKTVTMTTLADVQGRGRRPANEFLENVPSNRSASNNRGINSRVLSTTLTRVRVYERFRKLKVLESRHASSSIVPTSSESLSFLPRSNESIHLLQNYSIDGVFLRLYLPRSIRKGELLPDLPEQSIISLDRFYYCFQNEKTISFDFKRFDSM